MGGYIPIEDAEAIILYYMKIHYLVRTKQLFKIYYYVDKKARELGMHPRTAAKIVKFARRIGMIDTGPYFNYTT